VRPKGWKEGPSAQNRMHGWNRSVGISLWRVRCAVKKRKKGGVAIGRARTGEGAQKDPQQRRGAKGDGQGEKEEIGLLYIGVDDQSSIYLHRLNDGIGRLLVVGGKGWGGAGGKFFNRRVQPT